MPGHVSNRCKNSWKLNFLPIFGVLFSASIHSVLSQIPAKKSDDFINSIGVAVHLYRTNGPYGNGTNVKNRLAELGIKHVRDQIKEVGLGNYPLVKSLADGGVKFTGFLQGDYNNAQYTPAWWLQEVKNAGAMYAYEAFEGPNESDLGFGFTYKGAQWPAGTKAFQIDLYNAVKNDSSIQHLPVLGPSIGGGNKLVPASAMGDISAYVDYGNFHYYKASGQSYSEGYPDWDLQSVKNFHNVMFGIKPYMATEGGYNTATVGSSISESLDAKYTLRYYLEYWRLGVTRTFKYELFDEGPTTLLTEDNFGLIANDGMRLKPAASAIKSLTSLLNEPFPSKAFSPNSLKFTITGADSFTHYNLLQKSNGKFYLIIWNDAPSWNASTRVEIANNDPLTITFNQPISEVKHYAPCTNGTSVVSTTLKPTSLNVTIPNHPFIYEIMPEPLNVGMFRAAHNLALNGTDDLLKSAGDGVPNLLKFAFNMIGSGLGQVATLNVPTVATLATNGEAGMPRGEMGTGMNAGKLKLTYIRRKSTSSPGISYAVQFNNSLLPNSWAVNGSAVESVASINEFIERVTVTDSIVNSKRYARVRVTTTQ